MDLQIQTIWNKVVDHFQAHLPSDTFEIWVAPVKPLSFEGGLLSLEVPNHFHAQWLEKNLRRRALEILSNEPEKVMEINFTWKESALPKEMPRYPSGFLNQLQPKESDETSFFKPKYIFERFVAGPTNRFAHAASLAVAQNPGKQFNPLFIYGNTGLGKTHLLYAIKQYIQKNRPGVNVIYANSETFVNEFIDSLKTRSIDAYRNRYRSAVCLLIDDVQFLIGKDQSEQEFFHTFNALFETNRQIVLTSDRPPKELQPLDGRLVSRFEWGVVADIKPPDFETRLAILRNKVELEGLSIPDEILQRLAQAIRTNVRVLEGSLKSLIAYSCLTGTPVDLEAVDKILEQMKGEMPEESGVNPTISQIQEVVSRNYNVSVADLKDKSRSASKVLPRQVAIYLARSLTNRSLDEIGRSFGGRDHSTIVHAVNKIQDMVKSDPFISTYINKLEKEIRGVAGA